MEYLKNKKVIAAVAVFLVLIVVGAVFFLVRNQSSSSSSIDQITTGSDLPELDPSDVGMKVTLRKDKKALMFELTKATDIEKVENELLGLLKQL